MWCLRNVAYLNIKIVREKLKTIGACFTYVDCDYKSDTRVALLVTQSQRWNWPDVFKKTGVFASNSPIADGPRKKIRSVST